MRLLRSGSEEEQLLASGGLWILSFKEENKQILRNDPDSMEGECNAIKVQKMFKKFQMTYLYGRV